MSTIKTNSIQPTTTSDTLVVRTGSSSTTRLSITPAGLIQIETGTTVTGVTCDALTVSGASILSGGVTVGNFSGNVSAKINSNYANSNGLEGCVVPLYSRVTAGTTTPLPPGTWFVYFAAEESSGNVDSVRFVMAKVWTVSAGEWLRFKVTAAAVAEAANSVWYSMDSDSTTHDAGTWTQFTSTTGSAHPVTLSTRFGSGTGTHNGILYHATGSVLGRLAGHAMRIQ